MLHEEINGARLYFGGPGEGMYLALSHGGRTGTGDWLPSDG